MLVVDYYLPFFVAIYVIQQHTLNRFKALFSDFHVFPPEPSLNEQRRDSWVIKEGIELSFCFQGVLLSCMKYNFWLFGRFSAQEDEDDSHPNLLRRTTIGNGLLCVPLSICSRCFDALSTWISWSSCKCQVLQSRCLTGRGNLTRNYQTRIPTIKHFPESIGVFCNAKMASFCYDWII